MTVDKSPLPTDTGLDMSIEPEDAPPSYHASFSAPPSMQRDQKGGPSNIPDTQPSIQNAPRSPAAASSQNIDGNPSALTSWFKFFASTRTTREVRATVRGLLQDLVKQPDAQSALGVLESCADACRTYSLPLSALLQERSIEGHSPLYWSIVSRTPSLGSSSSTPSPARENSEQERDTVVMALLSHVASLSDTTVDEVRLACLHASDHRFFQRLRRLPAFAPLSVSDEIILGGTAPVDDVEVEEVPGDEAGFVVHLRIPMFQKRMRVSQGVALEFIAKGRIWSLRFIEGTRSNLPLGYRHLRIGSWVVILSLLPHSPETWVDAWLVIEDPRTRMRSHTRLPPPSHSPPHSSPTPAFPPAPQSPTSHPTSSSKVVRDDTTKQESDKPKPKLEPEPRPKIEVRMKRNERLVAPNSPRSLPHRVIAASLDDDARGPSLQLDGCPYIESDGALVARLEARLVQPDSECVVC